MDALRPIAPRWHPHALRVGLAVIFVLAGIAKLAAPSVLAALLTSHDVSAARAVAVGVGFAEVLGGLFLIWPATARPAALGLSVLVVTAVMLFHVPVTLAGPSALEIALDAAVLFGLASVVRRPVGTVRAGQ